MRSIGSMVGALYSNLMLHCGHSYGVLYTMTPDKKTKRLSPDACPMHPVTPERP